MIDGGVANGSCIERVIVIVERVYGAERVIGILAGVVVFPECLRHFSIFTAANVERKVLINLEFVGRDHLKLGKSGVDEVLLLSS